MTLMASAMTSAAGQVALALTTVGLFLAFFRLVRGPSLPDRVVALDLVGALGVGAIAAYDVATEEPILLDAATVVALVAFLGTIAFARYVERKGIDE
ncbi:MAG TPA: cation:proton antiporter [Lacipirellulaceae bacterium]|nr:cation:proton antiporter [Lacipirellulaceae bacterium]HMP06682.1 cation:proton antiporter [Lacipirellulaceae bacterium]